MRECSSFSQVQETRGDMTSQTLARGSKSSQHHALCGGGTAGLVSVLTHEGLG